MSDILATSEDGTILYKRLTPKYLKETLMVTQNTLFISGNIPRTLGIPNDPEALEELQQMPIAGAKDGMSIIAVDKTTDRVAGVCINKFQLKNQPFFESFRSTFKNYKNVQYVDYLSNLHKDGGIFEHLGADCVMQILFLGVSPDYRKKGIAKKLCEMALELAQKLRDGINIKLPLNEEKLELEPVPVAVYAMFTSFISQKIGRELGFEIAAEKSMDTVEIMGQVIKNRGDTAAITVEYKLLKKSTK